VEGGPPPGHLGSVEGRKIFLGPFLGEFFLDPTLPGWVPAGTPPPGLKKKSVLAPTGQPQNTNVPQRLMKNPGRISRAPLCRRPRRLVRGGRNANDDDDEEDEEDGQLLRRHLRPRPRRDWVAAHQRVTIFLPLFCLFHFFITKLTFRRNPFYICEINYLIFRCLVWLIPESRSKSNPVLSEQAKEALPFIVTSTRMCETLR